MRKKWIVLLIIIFITVNFGFGQEWHVVYDHVFSGQVIGPPLALGSSLLVLTGDRRVNIFRINQWGKYELSVLQLPRRSEVPLEPMIPNLAVLRLTDNSGYLLNSRGLISRRLNSDEHAEWRRILDEIVPLGKDSEDGGAFTGITGLPSGISQMSITDMYRLSDTTVALVITGWRFMLLEMVNDNSHQGNETLRSAGETQMDILYPKNTPQFRYWAGLLKNDRGGNEAVELFLNQMHRREVQNRSGEELFRTGFTLYWYSVLTGEPGLSQENRISILEVLLAQGHPQQIQQIFRLVTYEYDFQIFLKLLEKSVDPWWYIIAQQSNQVGGTLDQFINGALLGNITILDQDIMNIVSLFQQLTPLLAPEYLNTLFSEQIWVKLSTLSRSRQSRDAIVNRDRF